MLPGSSIRVGARHRSATLPLSWLSVRLRDACDLRDLKWHTIGPIFTPPYAVQGGILSLLFIFYMYGYRFVSRGFTDRREILHCGSA